MNPVSRNKSILLILFAALMLSGGCATMSQGMTDTVYINSEPPGQLVRVGGKNLVTPVSVELSRAASHYIEFTNGILIKIEPQMIEYDGFVIGDSALVFLGILPGIIALGIDGTTNAWSDLHPDHVYYRDGNVYDGKTSLCIAGQNKKYRLTVQ